MFFIPIIGIVMSFGTIIVAIITITNYLLKKRLIQSGNLSPENMEAISKNFTSFKFDNLKWGLILLFAGIGMVIIDQLPLETIQNFHLPIGIELIAVALGFLIYFFYMKNKEE